MNTSILRDDFLQLSGCHLGCAIQIDGKRQWLSHNLLSYRGPLQVSFLQHFPDNPQCLIPLSQNSQRVKSNLKRQGAGMDEVFQTRQKHFDDKIDTYLSIKRREIMPKGGQPKGEEKQMVLTASTSFLLKKSMFAKKMGDGILKIFTPSGSMTWRIICTINIGLSIFHKQSSVPFWTDKSDSVFCLWKSSVK